MIKIFLSPFFVGISIQYLAILLGFLQWKKLKKNVRFFLILFFLGTNILFFFSLPFVANNMVAYLERDYMKTRAQKQNLDAVVVLAGGFTRGKNNIESALNNLSYTRVVAGVRAFKESNAKILVMSGGTGDRSDKHMVELMRELAVSMGIKKSCIILDSKSRNTFEHPIKMLEFEFIHKNDKIGIATSAWHLPRAMDEFNRYFSKAIPIACNYSNNNEKLSLRDFVPNVGELESSTTIVHEVIGKYWYKFKHFVEKKKLEF